MKTWKNLRVGSQFTKKEKDSLDDKSYTTYYMVLETHKAEGFIYVADNHSVIKMTKEEFEKIEQI